MTLLDKMERSRFGRFGIPNLMKYVTAVTLAGAFLSLINPGLYYNFLCLDVDAILNGEVWRLLTFVFEPAEQIGESPLMNFLWFAVWAFVYYSVGTSLEKMWGTFRFNLFYFGGLLLVIVMTFVYYLFAWEASAGDALYFISKQQYPISDSIMEYLNHTLFIAYAFTFPNAQLLFYFVIPIKAKWFSVLYLVLEGYTFVRCLMDRQYYSAALIVVLLLNFFLFYLMGRGSFSAKQAYQQRKRKVEYRKKAAPNPAGARHRCVICGRTEEDVPGMEFRFCSKCEGNYEYCADHLFTHEHVHHD